MVQPGLQGFQADSPTTQQSNQGVDVFATTIYAASAQSALEPGAGGGGDFCHRHVHRL